jgi:hypothetical protein
MVAPSEAEIRALAGAVRALDRPFPRVRQWQSIGIQEHVSWRVAPSWRASRIATSHAQLPVCGLSPGCRFSASAAKAIARSWFCSSSTTTTKGARGRSSPLGTSASDPARPRGPPAGSASPATFCLPGYVFPRVNRVPPAVHFHPSRSVILSCDVFLQRIEDGDDVAVLVEVDRDAVALPVVSTQLGVEVLEGVGESERRLGALCVDRDCPHRSPMLSSPT